MVVLYVEGRLDTGSAPQLARRIRQWGDDITDLVLDFSKLSYISSMGLRVLLQAQKEMNAKQRKLTIRSISEPVREVFEMTGFIKLLVHDEKLVIIKKEENGFIIFSLIGQMDSVTVSLLEDALVLLKEQSQEEGRKVQIALDAEKLALTATGGKVLAQVLRDSGWPNRTLIIRGASGETRAVLETEGLREILED
jgi:anti-sigma B factor antagonist